MGIESRQRLSPRDAVVLGLSQAFVAELADVPEEERRLTPELADRLNRFGRTLDGNTDLRTLLLPTQWLYANNNREKATPLGRMVGQLPPRRIVRPWNIAVHKLGRVYQVNTIDDIRAQGLPIRRESMLVTDLIRIVIAKGTQQG